MTREDMAEILAVLQDHFSIRNDCRIDFASEAGDLHSGRVLNALKKTGLEASIQTMSLLAEHIERTPPTGSKLVDILIEKIYESSEGVPVDPPPAPRGDAAPPREPEPVSRAELAKAAPQLIRMGIDPEAPIDIQRSQFRAWVLGMKAKLARDMSKGAKSERAKAAPSREQAEKALEAVRAARRPGSPIDPGKIALGAYAEGERVF